MVVDLTRHLVRLGKDGGSQIILPRRSRVDDDAKRRLERMSKVSRMAPCFFCLTIIVID